MTKRASENSPEVSPSTKKGRLLERLVADLYRVPDVQVETNVRLPVPGTSGRSREIDVLVSGRLAGHPIRLPIECKNYRRRIGAPDIDAFVGKLTDLQLPCQGIYVSTIGFSKGALDRASKANIRPLLLSGLVDGRLASAVVDVARSVVYLLLEVTKISVVNDIPSVREYGALHVFYDAHGIQVGCTSDLVWSDWTTGKLPAAIGSRTYSLVIPDDWSQSVDGVVCRPRRIDIEYFVHALVVNLRGTGTRHGLHDPASGLPEKLHAEWSLEKSDGPLPLLSFKTEGALKSYLESRAAPIRITIDEIRLPRIRSGPCYWPPSDRVMQTVAQLHSAFLAAGAEGPPDLRGVDFEGPNLDTIYEPIWKAQRVMPDRSVRPGPPGPRDSRADTSPGEARERERQGVDDRSD